MELKAMCKAPFETAQEAIHWALEFSQRREYPRTSLDFDLWGKQSCEIVDVFNAVKLAHRQGMINDNQYGLFLYAKQHGDVPTSYLAYKQWVRLIDAVEPVMIDKGIVQEKR